MDDKPIGTKLYDLRISRGETQEQVADSVGISYVSLSRYETGQRIPKINIVKKLANYFGVSLDDLLGNSTDVKLEIIPKTIEARIVSGGMDKLPQEDREQILSILRAMYAKRPEIFMEGDQGDDNEP